MNTNPRLEIFSQGEEIITGQIADTNAAWLSQQAITMGFNVCRHTAVGDKLDDLIQTLLDIANRADCCISTGGLGPTSDDLTAEAVSKAFNLPLEFNELAFRQIQRYFQNRDRQMPACNRKQALLPAGSLLLENTVGTAPGFALTFQNCWFAFVPGVPSEMRHLFSHHIQPMWANQFDLKPKKLISIKTIGIGESELQERINKIAISPEVQLGFRAELGEVQVKLLYPNNATQQEMENFAKAFGEAVGDSVYAIDFPGQQPSSLVSTIDQLMVSKGYKLAIFETISHGLLAAKLVGKPWLLSAIYEQSLNKQRQHLNLANDNNIEIIDQQMLLTLKPNSDRNLVLIQLTDDISDSNLTNDKTIIVTHVLTAHGEQKQTVRTFSGNIERNQMQATMHALDLLRRFLQGKKIL